LQALLATSPTSGTVQEDVDDLAIDPTTGIFYAVMNNGSSGGSLVTIDPVTGVSTVIGDLGVDDIEGMSFDIDGNLFGSTGTNTSSPANDGSELYAIDLGTGAATFIGEIESTPAPPFRDVEALACLIDVVYFGSWSGTVLEDTTGDGAGDAPIGGVVIELFEDTDGDGVLSAAELAAGPVQSTTTDPTDGSYEFTDVPPGDYVAVETQPAGLGSISENEGGADNDQPDNGVINSIAGTVVPNENDSANDFVEARAAIEILKTVYAGNNNGASCPGGELISGVNGDLVTYCFTVNNTGATHLNAITLTDNTLSPAITRADMN